MDEDDLVIIEDRFAMSLETVQSVKSPESHVGRTPVSGDHALQTATSQASEDGPRFEGVRGGCGPQSATLFDHHLREHTKPLFNGFADHGPEGPHSNSRVKHNSPVTLESHVHQNQQTFAPYPLFELPHRVRQVGNVGPNDHVQFLPPVSYSVLSVSSKHC